MKVYHFDRFSDLRVEQPKAARFKDFVFDELIDYVDEHYATSDFRAMIGHSDGAEFNHFGSSIAVENKNYNPIPRVVVARIYYMFGEYDKFRFKR